MDSRIEELAQIIRERAGQSAETVRAAADGFRGDRYHSWRQLERLASEMQQVIDDYRHDHPEEYVDLSSMRTAQQLKDANEQIVALRTELRQYREREQTTGWNSLP